MIKEYRDAKIKLYISENNEYDDYEVDVAFLGDSLTDGYDVKSYYPDYLVVNRGIGGDTTFDLENRLQVSLYDLKPKVIVMLIGANNFKTMFDNYENILKGFQQNVPNSKVILLSLTSMSKEWGKNNNIAKENNIKIQELATKYNYEFIDLYNPLLNPTTNEIYEEYTTDGGHLTPKGYEVLTKCITPIIKQQLDKYHLENE
jgi:lysophospholipase L1-like esterase